MYTPTTGDEMPFARLACGLVALARSSVFKKRPHEREEEDEDAAAKSKQARGVLRLVPIWATCLAYGVVYVQVMTLFNKQGRNMDRRVFGGLELPPASLQMIGAGSVLAFVPIYDHVLVPILRWSTGNPLGMELFYGDWHETLVPLSLKSS
jgi:peptide/histidine transporter 3/4